MVKFSSKLDLLFSHRCKYFFLNYFLNELVIIYSVFKVILELDQFHAGESITFQPSYFPRKEVLFIP